MIQIQGITRSHPFAVYDINTGVPATTLTNPVCTYKINGGSKVTFTPIISAYDATMCTFSITIPKELVQNAYDSIEICITATEGEAHLLIDIMLNLELFVWKMRHKVKFLT